MPEPLGFLLLDSQFRFASANQEAVTALSLKTNSATNNDAKEAADYAVQQFVSELVARVKNGALPTTFEYGDQNCNVLQFSCAYAGKGEWMHAVLLRPRN